MYNNFNELLKVLKKEKPSRPVLFEMMMNNRIYKAAAGKKFDISTPLNVMLTNIYAFKALGYDYATVRGSEMWYHTVNEGNQKSDSISLNEHATIFDKDSFDNYEWMDPHKCNYSNLDKVKNNLPSEMKLIPMGPGGVLENVISLVGFDNLCYMLYDDEQLVWDLFEQVGSRLVGYYQECLKHDTVGAIISNDDWGFNTSTMLSVEDMRRFVFYWHKKIVNEAHAVGKPAILHSCGNFSGVIEDLYALGYDGRHSYEDNILPVEQSYALFKGKLAVLGGIDVDFLIRETPENIKLRAKKLLENSLEVGGYALGSGNSIPEYVPDDHYYAMIEVAMEL
jgi:uroporphyrinogen decarboxylase